MFQAPRLDFMCILAEISGALVKIFRGRGRKANISDGKPCIYIFELQKMLFSKLRILD